LQAQLLRQWFRVFLVLFLLTSVALGLIDAGLRNEATPYGIVSFEFCGFTSTCGEALDRWGARGQGLAMLSLGLDYLYLFLYPGLILISLMRVAPHLPGSLSRGTMRVAGVCPFISLADAIENYGLVQVILMGPGTFYGVAAGVFATIKFLLLIFTLGWLLYVSVRAAFYVRQVDE
jgi:hypothetical protein